MYIPEAFKCDICGIDHTPSNGWYLVEVIDTGARRVLQIAEFDVISAKKSGVSTVCGPTCLPLQVSKKLGELNGS